MPVKYNVSADSLVLKFASKTQVADTVELTPGVRLKVDATRRVLSVEVLNASQVLDAKAIAQLLRKPRTSSQRKTRPKAKEKRAAKRRPKSR